MILHYPHIIKHVSCQPQLLIRHRELDVSCVPLSSPPRTQSGHAVVKTFADVKDRGRELLLGRQKRVFTCLLQVPLGVDRMQSPGWVLRLLLTRGLPRWQSRPRAVNGRDCRVYGRSWLWRSIIYLLQLNSRLLSPAADKQVES